LGYFGLDKLISVQSDLLREAVGRQLARLHPRGAQLGLQLSDAVLEVRNLRGNAR